MKRSALVNLTLKVVILGALSGLTGCNKFMAPLIRITPVPPSHGRSIILLMGQSNMVGAGMNGEFPAVQGLTITGPRKGPGYVAGSRLLSTLGETLLIQCAVGGTSMAQWQGDKGGLYTSCIETYKAMKSPNDRIAGVLFMQGESDGVATPTPQWDYMFSMLVSAIRRDLGNIPVIYGQIGSFAGPSADAPSWAAIQAAQAGINLPGASMVSTSDLPLADTQHFTEEGYMTLGQRMAQTFLAERS